MAMHCKRKYAVLDFRERQTSLCTKSQIALIQTSNARLPAYCKTPCCMLCFQSGCKLLSNAYHFCQAVKAYSTRRRKICFPIQFLHQNHFGQKASKQQKDTRTALSARFTLWNCWRLLYLPIKRRTAFLRSKRNDCY